MGLFSDSAILAILAEKFLTLKYNNNTLFSQKFFSHIFQSKIDFKISCANTQVGYWGKKRGEPTHSLLLSQLLQSIAGKDSWVGLESVVSWRIRAVIVATWAALQVFGGMPLPLTC